METIATNQREFFFEAKFFDYEFRKKQLTKLFDLVKKNEIRFFEALKTDLGRSHELSYTIELGVFYNECQYILKNLKKWMKAKKVGETLATLPSKSVVYHCSYGSTLIIAPWNYPFFLAMMPLLGAIAGGNCAVIKPSELTPNLSKVLANVLNNEFEKNYIHVVEGGIAETQTLLKQNFDYIFFTGSPQVGKIIMEAAAKHLTPITLELGGKSPCLIDASADLKIAAKRITWAKFLNCGQTCVAPDYLVVESSIKNEFLGHMKEHLQNFYGENPQQSEDYTRIVSQKHLQRLVNLAKESGGTNIQYNLEDRYLAPVLIENASWNSPIMKEEIFGPVLPIIEVEKIDDCLDPIKKEFEPPLAFYYYGSNENVRHRIAWEMRFGGGCFNDSLLQMANHHLPFGGVKSSGIGRYGGRNSFEAFTYQKSILEKGFMIDPPLRYPPIKKHIGLIRKIFG